MAHSRRFRALRKRINQLEADLLPPAKPAGNYTLAEQDRVRAFRLLVHAEIEGFLEQMVEEVLAAALIKYGSTGRPNRVLKAVRQSLCRDDEVTASTDFFDAALVEFRKKVVAKNHGLKARNVHNLFLPLGIDPDLLNTSWLNALDAFGESRGQVAHQPYNFQVNLVLDPIVEQNSVNQLVVELDNFDQLIAPLRRS